jgi:hypothetical protein
MRRSLDTEASRMTTARIGFILQIFGISTFVTGCLGAGVNPNEKVCTMIYAYGATVTVTEAGTSNPIDDATVSAVSSEGSSAEPFTTDAASSPGVYIGLGEAPGTWTITAAAPGFESSTQTVTIALDEAECHVVGQNLRFELQRLPD